jgi:hypothetical protein
MKSLKGSLVVIFFAAVASVTVHGQTGSTLKPSELNNMIAFYEWVLEAKFRPEQRQQLRAALEDELKQDPAKARENLSIVLNGWEQVKQGSEEMRRQTRAEFLPGYLAELKKRADPKHSFLLDIYKEEHEGRETFTALDAARGNVVDKSDLHAASGDSRAATLVGRWERHTGSGAITDGTGKTKYGNGTTYSFQFGAGGTVVYKVVEKTLSIMGCKIETAAESGGKFTANGNSLEISLAAGAEIGTDSCTRSENYKKLLPPAKVNVHYTTKQSDDPTRPDRPILLCFDNGNGEACFERVPL